MRRQILIALPVLLVAAMLGLAVFVGSGPKLLPHTSAILDEVLAAELPEPVTGTTGVVQSGDIDIWYEARTHRSNPKATVLLVMGIGSTALVWPEFFLQPPDHVMESITGHLSRRMLEHYSHIRLEAKRKALEAWRADRKASEGRKGETVQ